MPLEQRRILGSVELVFTAKAINVRWLDQIVLDGKVISETPHRRAFAAPEMQDLPDPENPFAAAAQVQDHIARFADKLVQANEDLVAARAQIENLNGTVESQKGQIKAQAETQVVTEAKVSELVSENATLRASLTIKVAEVEVLRSVA